MIRLKLTRKQGFSLSLEDIFFEKSQGWGQIDPRPSRFRVSFTVTIFPRSHVHTEHLEKIF